MPNRYTAKHFVFPSLFLYIQGWTTTISIKPSIGLHVCTGQLGNLKFNENYGLTYSWCFIFHLGRHGVLSTPCRHYFLTEGHFSPCFSYFSTFSAEPKRRDDRCHVFPISLHSVLNLNKRKIFALLPLFPYI